MSPLEFECGITQPFGANYNNSYAASGLDGHTGTDCTCGYGTPIHALRDGLCYATYTPERPANDGYTAIFTIVESPLETYELSYGHVSAVAVSPGDRVQKGQVIGAEGNKGQVFQGGVQITLAMQAAGDHRGSHRHVQKRPLLKVPSTMGRPYLQNAQGAYLDIARNYYVHAFSNGYAGCTNLLLPLFNRDLWIGNKGYDVLLLQRALIKEGLLDAQYTTGVFGTLTRGAVQRLQAAWAINPTLGYVGVKTRGFLNQKYPG